jgi:predicted nucleic acid-binding protein
MKRLFADTSFLVACVSPRDQNHDAALAAVRDSESRIVVTEFVLLEFANALSSAAARNRVVDFWSLIRQDPLVEVVPISVELLRLGLDLFARRDDKDWSLTDCISFVVMEDYGLTEALTADHHFEQAGFSVLLSG